jgi:hypothetical protein
MARKTPIRNGDHVDAGAPGSEVAGRSVMTPTQ